MIAYSEINKMLFNILSLIECDKINPSKYIGLQMDRSSFKHRVNRYDLPKMFRVVNVFKV